VKSGEYMHKFVPAGDVLTDLKKSSDEYETAAKDLSESEAAKLRKLAELCRDWMQILTYGRWNS
jgi:hypothetical protein